MVWTEGFGRSSIPKTIRSSPWVYVALPNQEIEYFQMHEDTKDEPRRQRWLVRATRVWRLLKALAIL